MCNLSSIRTEIAFNAAISTMCQLFNLILQDGTYELNHPFELNVYVDTIIKAVLQYGGSRKIVFSCFNPDICTM